MCGVCGVRGLFLPFAGVLAVREKVVQGERFLPLRPLRTGLAKLAATRSMKSMIPQLPQPPLKTTETTSGPLRYLWHTLDMITREQKLWRMEVRHETE
jgi:hypothetical protein